MYILPSDRVFLSGHTLTRKEVNGTLEQCEIKLLFNLFYLKV